MKKLILLFTLCLGTFFIADLQGQTSSKRTTSNTKKSTRLKTGVDININIGTRTTKCGLGNYRCGRTDCNRCNPPRRCGYDNYRCNRNDCRRCTPPRRCGYDNYRCRRNDCNKCTPRRCGYNNYRCYKDNCNKCYKKDDHCHDKHYKHDKHKKHKHHDHHKHDKKKKGKGKGHYKKHH